MGRVIVRTEGKSVASFAEVSMFNRLVLLIVVVASTLIVMPLLPKLDCE